MACGIPVISSTRGSLQEVVQDAALTVDPENPAAIAAALGQMAGDARERDRWRAGGLANAARFDWNVNAARTLEVYELALKLQKADPAAGL
jgi:glycosyltransferase involved in cell wall biosynthesis